MPVRTSFPFSSERTAGHTVDVDADALLSPDAKDATSLNFRLDCFTLDQLKLWGPHQAFLSHQPFRYEHGGGLTDMYGNLGCCEWVEEHLLPLPSWTPHPPLSLVLTLGRTSLWLMNRRSRLIEGHGRNCLQKRSDSMWAFNPSE